MVQPAAEGPDDVLGDADELGPFRGSTSRRVVRSSRLTPSIRSAVPTVRLNEVPGVGHGWQAFPDWPPTDARQVRLSLTTDGRLSPAPDAPGTRVFAVNTDPAPARAGENLSFDSGVLPRELVLAGGLEANVRVSTTASDGNVAVVVQDVAADGTASRITAGWLKTSHRCGHEALAPVRPGVVYPVPVHGWPTHYRLAAGHRLRIVGPATTTPRSTRTRPRAR